MQKLENKFSLTVLTEAGYEQALLGMALSYYDGGEPLAQWWTPERQEKAAKRAGLLAFKQGGHNKFLESLQVWMAIKASRGFWQEFDTYRVGMTKQSASTMHTISKRPLTEFDFIGNNAEWMADLMNTTIRETGVDINEIKAVLPEGFLQYRVVSTNYKTLQNIVYQRQKHRLQQWRDFCQQLEQQLNFKEFVFPVEQ
jgi:hypothetical protein